jgi:hypothetical protein
MRFMVIRRVMERGVMARRYFIAVSIDAGG